MPKAWRPHERMAYLRPEGACPRWSIYDAAKPFGSALRIALSNIRRRLFDSRNPGGGGVMDEAVPPCPEV